MKLLKCLWLVAVLIAAPVEASTFKVVAEKPNDELTGDAVVKVADAVRNNNHKVVFGRMPETILMVSVKPTKVGQLDMLKLSVQAKGGANNMRVAYEYCKNQFDFPAKAAMIVAKLAPPQPKVTPAKPKPEPLLKNPVQKWTNGPPLKKGDFYWVTNVKGKVGMGKKGKAHEAAYLYKKDHRYRRATDTHPTKGILVLVEDGASFTLEYEKED